MLQKAPELLRAGDTIHILATARKIPLSALQPAIKMLQSWGLKVTLGENIKAEDHQFAGSDAERIADLQAAINNPNINAILCARGGYGTVRLLDSVDFSALNDHPKWLIGYSDVTALHSHVHTNVSLQTLHATMPINFPEDGQPNTATESLRAALFEGSLSYSVDAHPLNRAGAASAPLVGGNLSMLYSLTGTNSDLDTRGKILFLEDLDEYLYHVDRMLWNLDKGGMLSGLKGLIVGGMSDMNDNAVPFGKTAEEIIAERVAQYDFPVCYGFPAGHIDDNRALVFGKAARLVVEETQVTFYG